MNADGSGIHRLTKLRYVSGSPAWSPDGKRLAFQSNVGGTHYEIYTIGRDGTGVRQVTSPRRTTIHPRGRPTGS